MKSNTLHIYNAHNGATYEVPKPVRFASLQKLKMHLHETATDDVAGVENIILLTSFGIKLDFQIVNDMQELFLFDRRLFQNSPHKDALLASYLAQEPARATPRPQPGALGVAQLVAETNRVTAHINVMFRALNIIFQFTTNFIFAAEKAFQNYGREFRSLAAKSLSKTWRKYYSELQALPEVQFRHRAGMRLADLLNAAELEAAAAFVEKHMPQILHTNGHMAATLEAANRLKIDIDSRIAALRSTSVAKFARKADVVAQIEALGPAASRTTSESALESATKCYDLLQEAVAFKAEVAQQTGEILEQIAQSQMKSVEVKSECKKLFENDEVLAQIRRHESLLAMTVDLPLLFGFILIERRRQYEWADYFSKGVVHNVSEQMTILIDHEKRFQNLWNKRFGSLMHNLDPAASVSPQVPVVDVTLVNATPKPVFAWLDFLVERDDLSGFIEAMRPHQPEKSVLLLERNFKDLVASTAKLKATTKIIASLSTTADYEASSRVIRPGAVDDDADLNQMKGLRCRIKKLEDLLHQHQYKNLDGWPVVHDAKSVLLSAGKRSVLYDANAPERPKITHHFSEPNNPIKLLGDKKPLREPLDASGTIDKHLENLRLKRELKEMQAKLEVSENASRELERVAAESEIMAKDHRLLEKKHRDSEQRTSRLLEECESLKTTKQNSDSLYKETLQKLANATFSRSQMEEKYSALEEKYSALEEKYSVLEEKYQELEKNHSQLEERNQTLAKQLDEVQSLKLHNSALQSEVAQTVQLKNAALRGQDDASRERDVALEERDVALKERDVALEERDAALEERNTVLEERNTALNQKKAVANENALLLVQIQELKGSTGSPQTSPSEISRVLDENGRLASKLNEVESVNSELLSNMKAKEEEFRSERSHSSATVSQLQADNEELRARLETKSEDFEALMEVMQGKSRKMDEVMASANGTFLAMFQALQQLLSSNMAFFYEFCEILESMGLLLVAETNMGVTEYRIRRVKGLRSKKEQNEIYEVDVGGATKSFRSAVVAQMTQRFDWIHDLKGLKTESEDSDMLETSLQASAARCAELLPKVDEFRHVILFRPDGPDNEPFFLNAILKRFRDVEGFAKKLTKETRKSDKISVNNFHEGDLLLFLPTKKENDQASPWAAFNIDAPHYFLQTDEDLGGKEYIMGRVSKIEEHVAGTGDNPYGLSDGIHWFSVSI